VIFVDIGRIVDHHCLNFVLFWMILVKLVMVNNFTNINKTKERLDSDGQQFYQYQQNQRKIKQ
jgi:hypothetical protein